MMSNETAEGLIVDEFVSNGYRIAIINNEKVGEEVDPNALILMKMVFDGKEYTLEALTDEEYDRAYNTYVALVELGEEDKNTEDKDDE